MEKKIQSVDDAGGSAKGRGLPPASDERDEGVAGEPGVSDQCGERGPRGELVVVVVMVVARWWRRWWWWRRCWF